MIAVDTNILIYAHRGETEFHERAVSELVALADGAERWVLPVSAPRRPAVKRGRNSQAGSIRLVRSLACIPAAPTAREYR